MQHKKKAYYFLNNKVVFCFCFFFFIYPLFEYGDFLPKLEAGDSEVKIKMLFPFLYPVLSYFSRALNFVKDCNECPHVLIDWILRSNFKTCWSLVSFVKTHTFLNLIDSGVLD